MDKSFNSFAEFLSVIENFSGPDSKAEAAARERNLQLTKPPFALGKLEELAIWFASWQGTGTPKLKNPQVVVFAGNHGIAAKGVSAFPPEVTVQMVANFHAGGAAINQLSNAFGAKMDVVELDLENPTKDFSEEPAMTEEECLSAIAAGWNAVDESSDLFVAGEMGIGNTTSAAAICNALFGGEAAEWAGRGTGLDEEGVLQKSKLIRASLELHENDLNEPLDILRILGGREVAAMAGAIAGARAKRIPVIIDGFICSAAAAVLHEIDNGALDHAIAGHISAEATHQRLLRKINKEALLSMDMRLGEGSGATLAIGILKGAVACHSGMATFAEAGVAEG